MADSRSNPAHVAAEGDFKTEEKSNTTGVISLSPFPFEKPNDYFTFNVVTEQVKILAKGVDLLAAYYHLKYSSNIARPKQSDGDFMDVISFLEKDPLSCVRKTR